MSCFSEIERLTFDLPTRITRYTLLHQSLIHSTTSDRMPFNVAYVAGEHMAMMTFASQSQWGEWRIETQTTKNHIDWINDNTTSPNPRLGHYKQQWLPSIDALEQKWGSKYVPADIQKARVEVRDRLVNYNHSPNTSP